KEGVFIFFLMAEKASEPDALEFRWDDGGFDNRDYCYSDLLADPALKSGDSISGLLPSECAAFGYRRASNVAVDAATSSSGGSMSSASKGADLGTKRSFKDFEDAECHSEKAQGDSGDNSKHPSTCSSKRSRAAEVHNLSEKRRRNRINEKMKALQNLIPNSNKTDKASMLDEAIDYLKKLQLQVQILSARSGIDLSSMCMLSEMPHLQVPQIPKTYMSTGSAGVPLNMDRTTGLANMTQGSARSPLLSLRDPHPGSLHNMGRPRLSSPGYDVHNCMQASSKMGRLPNSVLPQLPTTSQ
ncbi:hypothetical protein KI387_015461, partial [Taxus chinensis]